MATPNLQIEGGQFVDLEGNPVANGYLLFTLSHDGNDPTAVVQVCAGLKVRVNLNSSGSVPASPATLIYSNDQILPSGSYYNIRCFKADGTEAWASSQNFVLTASPNPLDLGTLTPVNPPQSGLSGGGSTLILQTNGTNNSNQALLNLAGGTGITVSNTSGTTTITGSSQNVIATPTGFWVANGTSSAIAGNGQSAGFYLGLTTWNNFNATVGAVAATATTPAALNTKPNSSGASSIGSIGTAGTANLQSIARLRWSLRLDQTTSMRIWMGATTNAGSGFENDTLSTSFAGFRYSTHASDAKYQCVTNTGSAQTTTPESTASHVDATTFHVFEIQFVSPNVLFFIDGVQVGSQSTNLPAAATTLGFFAAIDNVGTVGQPAYDLAWVSALANF